MSKICFALIGCGNIGWRHAEHINNVGKLQAVCDVVIAKAEAVGNKYNATVYHCIEDLLQKEAGIDVVSICTPNGLHATHSIQALRACCHVLCEKPMAITVEDCYSMIDEAKEAGKQLFAIKQNRFNPPVIAVKQAIEKGILGKIFSFQLSCFWNRNPAYYKDTWKGSAELDGGTLFTQFSHFIDLMYWMFGDIKEVSAFTQNFAHRDIIDFEDSGVVVVKLISGAIGTINYTVNSYQKNMEGSLTIIAENGTVKIGGQYLNILEYENIEGFTFGTLPEGNKPNSYGDYTGSMSNHDKVYQNVVDVLSKGDLISANSFEAAKTVEIIEKIYASARKNNKLH